MSIEPFTSITGTAAAIAEENIDTDIVFPARFLLLTQREGLGRYAFHDRRFNGDGSEVPEFVLNQARFRDAKIIVAGANFGSGSSREQAVWALHGFGIRVVIAPSFGEIFAGNCLRNGMLALSFPAEVCAKLGFAAEASLPFTVDLEAQIVKVIGMEQLPFAISPERREALLNGWDETDQILNRFGADITAFEASQRTVQPWLYPEAQQA